jgi:hypothetical protein
MSREYKALHALNSGESIDVGEGLMVRKAKGEIQVGDLYVGERNTGPKLLTAHVIDKELQCMHPTCTSYSYDLWECVKVEEAP